MRTVTKKHLSVREKKARFAEVTVIALEQGEETARMEAPKLFLNDFAIVRPNEEDRFLISAAQTAVEQEEKRLGWSGLSLRANEIRSTYCDVHLEAVQIAATAAAAALIEKA